MSSSFTFISEIECHINKKSSATIVPGWFYNGIKRREEQTSFIPFTAIIKCIS